MTTSVVTNYGLSYITQNSANGLQFNIIGAIFGSSTLGSDISNLKTYVDMPNAVYYASSNLISYSRIDDNNVLFRVRLGNDVGDFNIGAFGLLLPDNHILSISSLDNIEVKTKANDNGIGGNTRYYETIINVSNIANIVNLTILVSNDTSLPEVDTENQLPNPASAPFPVYFVHKWLGYEGKNALASRYNNTWSFYPCYELNINLFAPGVVPGNVVYFNENLGLFDKAHANDADYAPVAMCGQGYSLIRIGGFYVDPNPIFTPGTHYYVDNVNPGILSTNINNSHVGYAITSNTLILNNLPDIDTTVFKSFTIFSNTSIDNNFYMVKKNASLNEKIWRINQTANQIKFGILDDTYSNEQNYLTVNRGGNNLTSLTLSIQNANILINSSDLHLNAPNVALTLSTYYGSLQTDNSQLIVSNNNISATTSKTSMVFNDTIALNLFRNSTLISFLNIQENYANIAVTGAHSTLTNNHVDIGTLTASFLMGDKSVSLSVPNSGINLTDSVVNLYSPGKSLTLNSVSSVINAENSSVTLTNNNITLANSSGNVILNGINFGINFPNVNMQISGNHAYITNPTSKVEINNLYAALSTTGANLVLTQNNATLNGPNSSLILINNNGTLQTPTSYVTVGDTDVQIGTTRSNINFSDNYLILENSQSNFILDQGSLNMRSSRARIGLDDDGVVIKTNNDENNYIWMQQGGNVIVNKEFFASAISSLTKSDGTNAGSYQHPILPSEFPNSLNSSGYQIFPGGFILQWVEIGVNPGNVIELHNLPYSYPTAHIGCIASYQASSPPDTGAIGVNPYDRNSFSITNSAPAGTGVPNGIWVLSWGC